MVHGAKATLVEARLTAVVDRLVKRLQRVEVFGPEGGALLKVLDDNFQADSADEEGPLSDWPCTAVMIQTTSYTDTVIIDVQFNFTADKYHF